MSGKFKLFLVVVAVAALAGLGVGGGFLANRVALAADPPDTNGTFTGCGGFGPGGTMGGFGRGGMMGGFGGMMGFLDRLTLDKVAQRLGLTAADLQTKLQSGASLAELAQAANVSETDLIAILLANHKETVQLKVTQGYFTQEQADQMTKLMEQAAKNFITSKWQGGTDFGPRFGTQSTVPGPRGGAGMMGGAGGFGGMMGIYR